ncbi:GGDEF domain-containing protein [Ruminococcus sp.]|uniref:GGDEF domain-containing protein n=1 Tax=Ruminococcus sp. TaxID=41978 RepID=UPI0025F7A79C|nr:GGDEF domain-containing protein [Ruminococcus sp.]MBQ8965687.1 GGDEF domain-containing protein [Ruminococcus sp.]
MINSRKTIAVFITQVTTGYRRSFCRNLNITAERLGYNVVFFNFLGVIGGKHRDYGDYEYKLIDVIPYGEFAGIIFDEESFTVESTLEKLVAKIKEQAKCPVISVSSLMEDFYNICFDDSSGIEKIVQHLFEVHGCRRIGFMSGPLYHNHARVRLKAFKEAMKKFGLPEEGTGIFEGDFWFNKGEEAADFFLSAERERPEAIVCANDYMMMSLLKAFKKRGVRVPEDILLTGFDGTEEGQEFIPRLTTVNYQRDEIAEIAVKLIDRINNGEECPKITTVHAQVILGNTCGCCGIDYKKEVERVNLSTDQNRTMNYYLCDVIASTLKMNIVESMKDLEQTFSDHAVNFGGYRSFCLMTYVDDDGKTSVERGMVQPTKKVFPAMLVDRWGDFRGYERKPISTEEFLPTTNNDDPKMMYVTSMHCGDRCFGYSAVTMTGAGVFNEFYNVWLATLAVALESLLRSNNIQELISDLEDTSVRDGLTGLYNRRGFESRSAEAARKMHRDEMACAMVIDMDGLKKINDRYGHAEGDFAIRKLAEFIGRGCAGGKIAGRTGGDEFYIFVPCCDEEQIDKFHRFLEADIKRFNESGEKPYTLDASFGACLHEIGPACDVEELIRIADERMYEAKQLKKQRRSAIM